MNLADGKAFGRAYIKANSLGSISYLVNSRNLGKWNGWSGV